MRLPFVLAVPSVAPALISLFTSPAPAIVPPPVADAPSAPGLTKEEIEDHLNAIAEKD